MPISYVFAAYKAPRWSILVHDIPVGHADGGGYVGRPVDTFSTWSRRRRRRRRDEVPMYFPQTRCRESVGTCGGYVQVFQPNFQYHLLISLFTPPISLVTPYRLAPALTRRTRSIAAHIHLHGRPTPSPRPCRPFRTTSSALRTCLYHITEPLQYRRD